MNANPDPCNCERRAAFYAATSPRTHQARGAREGRAAFLRGENRPSLPPATEYGEGFLRGWDLQQEDEIKRSTPGLYRGG